MLFTDRELVTLADLETIEGPDISKLMATESLPAALLTRSIGDCGNRLLAAMQSIESYPGHGDLSTNHLAAVLGVHGTRHMPRVKLTQVCVNSQYAGMWSALKNWVAHYTLGQIYQAAWNKKVDNDRYKQKRDQYVRSAKEEMLPRLRSQGLPLVWSPLSAPAAVFEHDSGIWNTNNLATASSGGGELGGTFRVAVTYVDQLAYESAWRRGNAESHPSPELSVHVPPESLLEVNIHSLRPPQGRERVGLAQGVMFDRRASAWNVYVNSVLQTPQPLPITTKVFRLPDDPVTSQQVELLLGDGQHADIYDVMPHVTVMRG